MQYLSNTCLEKIWRVAFYVREYLFPFGCSLCGAGLRGAEEAWNGLCGTCHGEIERELDENSAMESCDYCGKPLISEHGRCLSCRNLTVNPDKGEVPPGNGEAFSFDQAKVLFPYTGKYRKLLAAYKFDKNLALGNFFAEKIQGMLKNHFPPDVQMVPVPPRPGKIRSTGWDQVEYLARVLERNNNGTDAPAVTRCLKRMPSKSQKELGRENRRNNLRGRILPVKQVPKIAVLIDDVMTTGSTLDACAAALKDAGTEKVYGLCLFYD